MLVSTKSLDINIDFWEFDINLKVFLSAKLALGISFVAEPRRCQPPVLHACVAFVSDSDPLPFVVVLHCSIERLSVLAKLALGALFS